MRVAKQYLRTSRPARRWVRGSGRLRSIVREPCARVESNRDQRCVTTVRCWSTPQFGVASYRTRPHRGPADRHLATTEHLGGRSTATRRHRLDSCSCVTVRSAILLCATRRVRGAGGEKTRVSTSAAVSVAASMTVRFSRSGCARATARAHRGRGASRPISPCRATGSSVMGIEGAVQLGNRALERSSQGARQGSRQAVARAYEAGQALNTATYFEATT